MPYVLVENFNGGLDRRRKISASPPGTLWELTNGHITRGGEIQKSKSFVSTFSLPAGSTKGLAALSGDLYVFGSDTEPSGLPSGINYQQLIHPSTSSPPALSSIVDVEVFDGKLYVIAKFADNSIYHYYDGTRVSYWDSGTVQGGASSTSDIATTLKNLIDANDDYIATVSSSVFTVTAANAGEAYSITGSDTSTNGDITWNVTVPNVAAVSEVLAVGSFSITGGTESAGVNMVSSVTVNGVTITSAAVDFTVSNAATAAAIAANITANTSSPNYTATSDGAKVIISAVANSGSTPNGYAVVCTEAGDVTHDTEVAMTGGVDAVAAVAQVTEFTVTGTWQAGDTYQIILNGTVFGGSTVNFTSLVLDSKIYVTAGSILRFPKINSPTDWDETISANIGAGFINISNQFSGSESLTGLAVYNNNLAVFARRAIQIWNMDADPDANAKLQTINSTGSRSGRAILTYSDNDVLYPSDSGIRTLKARDSSNTAKSNDIGRPIDKLVIDQYGVMTDDEIISMPAIVEPLDGRAWYAMKDKIFVLSSFPASGKGNISAWSSYEPGFDVEDMISVNNRVYVRSGDTVYLYGGSDNNTFDSSQLTAQLPFLDAKRPADFKELQGIDVDCEGAFQMECLVDPRDLTQSVHMGDVDGLTYVDENIDALGDTTHFAPKLTSTAAEEVIISNIAVHYESLGARS